MSGKATNNPYHYKMVVDSALEKDTAVPMNPEEYANANHTNGVPQPQPQPRQQPRQHTHHQRTIGVPARKKRTQTRKQRELQTERFQSTAVNDAYDRSMLV